MAKFTFKVTQTDSYAKLFTVDAEDLKSATKQLEKDLEACPLETQSGTLEYSVQDLKPIPEIHTPEQLFNIDEEESDEQVIRVADLSDEQKKYLGLII